MNKEPYTEIRASMMTDLTTLKERQRHKKVLCSDVITLLLYGNETWIMTSKDSSEAQAAHMEFL